MVPSLSLWLSQCDRRRSVLKRLILPATPSQLARRTSLSEDACSYTLIEFRARKLARCVNPKAARFRLYLLTRMGWQCRLIVIGKSDSKRGSRRFPLEFWRLYAEMLYPHRSAVIRTLIRPMQAAEIKRRASLSDSNLRISASNVREVLKFLLRQGIVRRFLVRRSAYPRFQLTDLGEQLREVLLEAEVRRS